MVRLAGIERGEIRGDIGDVAIQCRDRGLGRVEATVQCRDRGLRSVQAAVECGVSRLQRVDARLVIIECVADIPSRDLSVFLERISTVV